MVSFSFFAKITAPIIETYYLGGFYCESKRIHEKSDWSFLWNRRACKDKGKGPICGQPECYLQGILPLGRRNDFEGIAGPRDLCERGLDIWGLTTLVYFSQK